MKKFDDLEEKKAGNGTRTHDILLGKKRVISKPHLVLLLIVAAYLIILPQHGLANDFYDSCVWPPPDWVLEVCQKNNTCPNAPLPAEVCFPEETPTPESTVEFSPIWDGEPAVSTANFRLVSTVDQLIVVDERTNEAILVLKLDPSEPVPTENTMLAATDRVAVYRLNTGEYQINIAADEVTKVIIFDGLPANDPTYSEFVP